MSLRYVDPLAPKGFIRRLGDRVASTETGRWFGMNVAEKVDPVLLRRTGGRMRLVGPMPTALLSATGARSGQQRETPVVYFHHGDDVVLIASSFGREQNPAWYYNVRANPVCRLNGDEYVAAEVNDPVQYDRLFALGVKVLPVWRDYRERCEAAGRRIPLLRLTPR